jgi:hypothetical protein
MVIRCQVDSYSMVFFQPCWDVLKEDIMKVFHDFHVRGKFERSLNATFITIILKILGGVDPKYFCLINFVSAFTKLLL